LSGVVFLLAEALAPPSYESNIMDENPSPLLIFDSPVLFVMLDAAVDCLDWTVLVECWLEWLLEVVDRDMLV
jgi:hypothetical protein